MKAYRTEVEVIYEGQDITREISTMLLGFSYADSDEEAEELQFRFENRERKWMRDWFPRRGDTMVAAIKMIGETEEIKTLPCGRYEVDEVAVSGKPDIVTLKGISSFVSGKIKDTRRSQAWENQSYQGIVSELASKHGYGVEFRINVSKKYDKIQQNNESDIEFLLRLSKDLNVDLKIENGKVIVTDDQTLGAQEPVFSIHYSTLEEEKNGESKNKGFALLSYELRESALTSYCAAELQYKDPETGNVYKAQIQNKEQVTKKVLRLNDKVKSDGEAMSVCQKALDKENKETKTAKFTLAPTFPISAKSTVEVEGFGVFSGKYLINSVRHEVSKSGYQVELECSKV